MAPGATGTTPGGRVRIDPSFLAHANDEDVFGDLPSQTFHGSRPGGGAGSADGQKGSDGAGSSSRQSASGDGRPSPGSLGSQATTGLAPPSPGGNPGGAGSGDTHPKPTRPGVAPPTRSLSVDVPLDLVVACGRDGVIIHPGAYRLSPGALRTAGTLKRDLETIVRNHELIDPMVRPRPRVQFLIEPGGSDTYWEARRQTVLAGLNWPVTIQVAGGGAPRVFPKERF